MKKRSIHIIITLENIFIKIKGNTLLYILQKTLKTRAKVVHHNLSQGVKIRNSESKKTIQPLHNTKVVLCDLT